MMTTEEAIRKYKAEREQTDKELARLRDLCVRWNKMAGHFVAGSESVNNPERVLEVLKTRERMSARVRDRIREQAAELGKNAVNFGVKVKLWRRFTNCRRLTERIILALGGTETVEDFTELRNVTEIHFNHGRAHGHGSVSVAFESNIHGTGMTCELENLMEFETELEEAKAEAF